MNLTPIAIVAVTLSTAPFLAAQMDEANCPMHKQHATEGAKSAYTADAANAVKALSPETVAAYRNGTGMGLAIPAELNGYPGPRHVLDLGDQLHLTAEQRTKIQSAYDAMHAEAVTLGAEIIGLEEKLDRGFAQKTIDAMTVEQTTATIASLQGRLRAVHLKAHLAAKGILDEEQTAMYMKLRGYGSSTNGHQHHHTN